MRKELSTLLTLCFGLVLPAIAFAQGFEPVSPIGEVRTDNVDSYLEDIFPIFITVATVLGVIKLMICGLQYMTSESISSKSNARTCITYVIGGLLLILASFLILQTINRDFTEGTFGSIGNRISDRLGDISYSPFSPLDGADLAGSDLPDGEGNYQLIVNNACGGTAAFQETTESQCEDTLDDLLEIRNWSGTAPHGTACAENADGEYCYSVWESGANCSQQVVSNCLPAGGLFEFDATPCREERDSYLDRRQYTEVQGCTEIERNP